MILFYLGTFAASLLLSFLLTRDVRDLAVARSWVSPPRSDRHVHSRPLPRLGGVAIYLAFIISAGTACIFLRHSQLFGSTFSWRTLLTILAPASLVFALGVYDDLRPVGPYVKFAVQGAAATLLFAGGFQILNLPVLFGKHSVSWFIGWPLTLLWILGITNAFNLIDGLDGLAAGSALFSTLVVFAVSVVTHSNLVSLMSLALVGAIIGFLRFNFSPATIFLGDCGSLFIGFMLGALALQGAEKAPTALAVAIPVVSFGLPILETALSILRRFLSGRPVFTGDREHIHHKLLQRGLSPRQVVITLYAVSAIFALLSLFLLWPTGGTLGLVLTVLGVGVWIGVQRLGYLEFGELRRVAQRSIERQVLINNLAIRRATEELKVTQDYAQVCRILVAALSGNDFDAFDIRLPFSLAEIPSQPNLRQISPWGESPCLRWTRPGCQNSHELTSVWSLNLELITSHGRRLGSMTIYRLYEQRDLQLDINLLTSIFPAALAEALDRCLDLQPDVALIETRPDWVVAQV